MIQSTDESQQLPATNVDNNLLFGWCLGARCDIMVYVIYLLVKQYVAIHN